MFVSTDPKVIQYFYNLFCLRVQGDDIILKTSELILETLLYEHMLAWIDDDDVENLKRSCDCFLTCDSAVKP